MDEGMSDGGDSDLEAELAAITANNEKRRARKPKQNVMAPADLDKMISQSLRDIPSDEEGSDPENDPDLLDELQEIAGDGEIVGESVTPVVPENENIILPTSSTSSITLIKARIEIYNAAEANAKQTGDTSRARRYNRGLKTLKDLLKHAESGKTVDPSEIPPEIHVKKSDEPATNESKDNDQAPPVPARRAPAPPINVPIPDPTPTLEPSKPEEQPKTEDPRILFLNKRKDEFKLAALNAKKSGDHATALKYIKTVKQFDVVIEAVRNNQEVDLSNMPTLEKENSAPKSPPKEEAETQQSVASEETEEVPQEILITATTALEALEQRLDKFKSQEQAAKDEGNSSKARRLGRIVKQYQDAIKLHKAGKPIPFDELPTPPGYAPIPGDNSASNASTLPPPLPLNKPSPMEQPSTSEERPPLPKKSTPEQTRISGSCKNTTLMDKQIAFLLERQKEFRQAAIEAKKANEIEQAKEYLRIYKGMENLIDTARGGFPIDLATVPIPPSQRASLEDGFTIISNDDCTENDDGDMRIRLEEQLSKQLMMCKNTRDHHKAMGDVAGTNRFENLALSVQKDLDFVRLAHKKGLPIPKFHYEKRSFNIVKCNTDLSDNEVEIHVVRGINYSVSNPKDVDTYVKVEFPWPQVFFFK